MVPGRVDSPFRFEKESQSSHGRVGPLAVIACTMLVGCGATMHPTVCRAIHETLNPQFRSAGLVHPPADLGGHSEP